MIEQLTPRRSAIVGAVACLCAVQLAFALMPFTTETLWIGGLMVGEALEFGRIGSLVLDPEWWFALAFPTSVALLGALGAYSYVGTGNVWPAVVAVGFVGALYLTEIVFVGRFEFAILYVLLAPIAALLASGLHHAPRLLRTRAA